MEKITFKVDGMRCAMCEAHICDAVRRAIPKAKQVKASRYHGNVSFVIEDGTDFTTAKQRIESIGYRVLNITQAKAKKVLFFYR